MNEVNILHISDIHFGMESGKNLTLKAHRDNALNEMVNTLSKLEDKDRPHIVVISGDIAWQGRNEAYSTASEWITKLLDLFNIGVEELVVCAGNHDIDRTKTMGIIPPKGSSEADEWLAIENLENFIRPFESFESFCQELGIPKLKVGPKEFNLIGEREIYGIKFIVLNSAWFCRGNEDRGNLWLGLPQLQVMQAFQQIIRPDDYDNGPITVGVIHHPKEWLNDEEQYTYPSRPATYRYLSERSHLLLSGHVHGAIEDPTRMYSRAYSVIGGAAYAGGSYRNNFSILKVDKKARTCEQVPYEFDPRNGEWEVKQSKKFFFKVDREGRGEKGLLLPDEVALLGSSGGTINEVASEEKLRESAPKYSLVEGYLPRKVLPFEESGMAHWIIDSTKLCNLLDIIKDKKHVTLLGGAGTGKSTELRNLAAASFQTPHKFYPILINLNKYMPRSLVEILNEYWIDWNKVRDEQLLVILDGLDEVESKYKRDAIRSIEMFAEQRPNINIVVSCRRNFYQSGNKQLSGTLQGFNSYVLYELNQQDIELYVLSLLNVKALSFQITVQENNLMGLARIPFYLIRMVHIYSKTGALPKNKSNLYEELLNEGLNSDIEHFRNSLELNGERANLIHTLEIVALSMESLERNYLTNDEFQSLITSKETKELLTHCAVWKKREDSNGVKWQFEHNNFQEYLTARFLARQDIRTIKEFLSFPPEHKKVIPSWVNTLSFLVSMIASKDSRFIELLNWLQENDPSMIIHFEGDRVDEQLRTQMFQQIFNYYKEKKIWINRDKFELKRLADFGQSNITIEYLLEEIANSQHFTICVNALRLLSLMKVPFSKRSSISELLIGLVTDEKENMVVRSNALNALAELKFYSPEIIDRIVVSLRSSTNDMIRTYLYRYLISCDVIDDYIDVLLEGVKFIGISTNDKETRLLDEKITLEQALEKVKSSSGVNKLLEFFKDNINEIDDLFLKDQLSILGTKAAKIYEQDPDIFVPALSFFIILLKAHWRDKAIKFRVFFEKSQTKLNAVKILVQQRSSDEDNLWALGLLIDEEGIDYIVQRYLEHELNNDEVGQIQNILRINSEEIFNSFNKRINEISNNKFILPPKRDYEQERREELIQDINLLFNKEAFLEHLNMLYKNENKDTFTKDELIDIRVKRFDHKYSKLVIDTAYNILGEGAVSYDEMVDIIRQMDWEFFCVDKIHSYMSSSNEISLSSVQKQWITEWCLRHINQVDFKRAFKSNSNGGGSANRIAIHLWFFLRKLKLTYPEDVLLDMISFDWIEGSQMLGINYLEGLLKIEMMGERIWNNLEEGIEPDDVLKNHIDFCKRHSIRDVLPHTLKAILDSSRGSTVRGVALETYIELSQNISHLINELPKINDNFKWQVIEKIFDHSTGLDCQKYLIEILNKVEDESEKLGSAKYLIKLQNLEGLKFYVNLVKKKVECKQLVDRSLPLQSLKVIEALPHLIELLECTYQEGFKQNEFDRLDNEVRKALTSIAMQSTDNYLCVKREIEVFIEANQHIKNVNFLHAFVEDLEAQHLITLQGGREIKEVVNRLKEIGLIL